MRSGIPDADLNTFTDLCMAFYRKLRAKGAPRLLAYMLCASFLEANIKAGAAMQMAMETKDIMLYPGVKP